MAIFSTVFSVLAAFVPETHGPTLLKWRIAKEGKSRPPLKFSQVMAVFKVALARPVVYLFTGKNQKIPLFSLSPTSDFRRTSGPDSFDLSQHFIWDSVQFF
jgi:hypothetical protein